MESKDNSFVVAPISKLHQIVQQSVEDALVRSLPSIIKRASLPKYISTSELSRLASWSEGKIFYMRQEKRIKFVQEGRSIVYPTECVKSQKMLEATPSPRTTDIICMQKSSFEITKVIC